MKKGCILLAALMLALSLSACGGIDIEGFAQNRKVTSDSRNDNGDLVRTTEYLCDEGYALVTEGAVFCMKRSTEGDKCYLLNPADNTGFSVPLENIGKDTEYLEYSFEPYQKLGAKRVGGGKMAGVSADIYLLEYNGVRVKFWVGKQSDITLKCVTVNEEGEEVPDADDAVFEDIDVTPYNFEVIEIITGGVTLADAVNLEDYTILPAESLLGDPYGAAYYDRFGDSFGNAFEEALGAELGKALGEELSGVVDDAFNAIESIGNAFGNLIDRILP